MSLYDFDRDNFHDTVICGADEAGRGPLAGPVFAAAVILDPDDEIDGINDSKKLSPKKRELLYEEIIRRAKAYKVVSVDEKKIDEINILRASMLAMKLAIEALPVKPEHALIDGNSLPSLSVPATAVIKGDATSASIAAASILAKVERDRYMLETDKKYPQYQFAKHKGYPTALHYEMIKKYGVSEIHRKTFLKNLSEK